MSSLTRIGLFVSSGWMWFVRSMLLLGLLSSVLSPASTMAALVPLTGVKQIVASDIHTCALLKTGSVLCWGDNTFKELGNEIGGRSTLPVSVNGLTSKVMEVTAGYGHTCALLETGDVKCWGLNSYGQLGDGTKTNSKTPVTVTGLLGEATAISAGYSHTCALLKSGEIKCWGKNDKGQLGNGKTIDSNVPDSVTGLSNGVKSVKTSYYNTCVLLNTSEVKCWGLNGDGQLGNGTKTDSNLPVGVVGLNGVTAITVGTQHACAALNTGEVKCWGSNFAGQLGSDKLVVYNWTSSVPMIVLGVSKSIAISAGQLHTCALSDVGSIQCWGSNTLGQIGNGTTTGSNQFQNGPGSAVYKPVAVIGLKSNVIAITTGGSYTCALLDTNEIQCWGANGKGQLGNNTSTNTSTPVFVMIDALTYSITVDKTGTGSGTVSGGGNFVEGVTVKLTATPDANSTFTGWSPAPCADSFVMPAQNLTCTATFTPKLTTSDCSGKHATFDTATGLVTIPALDIPTLDPFTGESTGTLATFSAQLKLLKGIEDFGLVTGSFKVLQVDVKTHDSCNAEYTYADGKYSKGGTVHLPYVDVPSVIIIPPNVQVPGPTHVYDATLKQLALDLTIFHIDNYQRLGTLPPKQ